MVLFNYSTKELTAKIVYYGPGLCGKTTNLQFVYDSLPGSINKGKMLSLATKTDRTLFFDFLPIDLGMIRGMRTRLQLYTVPGQVFYNTTRKLVLKGADGVVFVADSQRRMIEPNLESFKNLEENLQEHGMKLGEMPIVIQFNKRDLPEALGVDELNAKLNRFNAPIYEAVATTGIGVHETLKAITRLVLNSLKEKYADRKELRPDPAATLAARAAVEARAAATPGQTHGIGGRSHEPMPAVIPLIATPSRSIAPIAPLPAPTFDAFAPAPDPVMTPPAGPRPSAHEPKREDEVTHSGLELPDFPGGLSGQAGKADQDLALSPESHGIDDDGDADFTLELAGEEDAIFSADAGADEALELAELLEEENPPAGASDPLLEEPAAAAEPADPLELPELSGVDALDLTDDLPVAEIPDELLLDGMGGTGSAPAPGDSAPPLESTAQVYGIHQDPQASGFAAGRAPGSRGHAPASFEEDRSALVLDEIEGPPLGLALPEMDSHPVLPIPAAAAPPLETVGPAPAFAPAIAPGITPSIAPSIAHAVPALEPAREITVPLNLSIGDQQIQFELRITLDLMSGRAQLAGADRQNRSAS